MTTKDHRKQYPGYTQNYCKLGKSNMLSYYASCLHQTDLRQQTQLLFPESSATDSESCHHSSPTVIVVRHQTQKLVKIQQKLSHKIPKNVQQLSIRLNEISKNQIPSVCTAFNEFRYHHSHINTPNVDNILDANTCHSSTEMQ